MIITMLHVAITFLFLFSLARSEEEEIPKILRVQKDGSSRKIVTMSDGELIVNLLMNNNGVMEDCKVTRRARMQLGMVKYDADNMSGEEGLVEYPDQEVDVQWYGRQCARLKSKANVPGETQYADIRAREKLDDPKGYPETKFCSRFGSAYHPNYNEPNNPEDECCRELRQCDYNIPYTFYRHGYLNVFFYDMYSCDCVERFKTCLEDIDSELSRDLRQAYFEYLDMKCFNLEHLTNCEQFSPWFDTCEKEFQFLKAIVN